MPNLTETEKLDEICAAIMRKVQETETTLAELRPSMESATYTRLAVGSNTLREVLRLIARFRGEYYPVMMERVGSLMARQTGMEQTKMAEDDLGRHT